MWPANQYCGALSKVENCQVSVFAVYASRQCYALVDKRLFLPEPWCSDAYAVIGASYSLCSGWSAWDIKCPFSRCRWRADTAIFRGITHEFDTHHDP